MRSLGYHQSMEIAERPTEVLIDLTPLAAEKVKALMVLDMVDLGSAQEIELPGKDETVDITEQAADSEAFKG